MQHCQEGHCRVWKAPLSVADLANKFDNSAKKCSGRRRRSDVDVLIAAFEDDDDDDDDDDDGGGDGDRHEASQSLGYFLHGGRLIARGR